MRRRIAPLLLVALAACGAPEPEPQARNAAPASETPGVAPASETTGVAPAAAAALVFEPPLLVVGEVTRVEVAVTTPPGHRVATPALPEPLEGFWLIGVEPPRVEKLGARWIHRIEMRVRAREVGRFRWPELTLSVETPDGTPFELPVEGRDFEVASVFPEFPEQATPFGLEAPPEPTAGRIPALLSAAAGAAAAFACVGLVLLVRRRRSAGAPARRPAAGARSWEEAREALAAARAELDADPVAAADRASRALRRYVTRRFGPDAPVRTTEELAATRAPRNMRSRWPGFVDLLQRLDGVRFRPPGEHRRQLAAVLEEAEHFVSDSIPPEEL